MIEFDHVSRTYGPKTAVADLSLAIPRGELFALLGPNGAGKTTSIKMLVGLLHPSRGSVRICGHDVVADPRAAHLHVGYVPDEPCLYDKLTGRAQYIADLYRPGMLHGAILQSPHAHARIRGYDLSYETYGELNARANRLARRLRREGVVADAFEEAGDEDQVQVAFEGGIALFHDVEEGVVEGLFGGVEVVVSGAAGGGGFGIAFGEGLDAGFEIAGAEVVDGLDEIQLGHLG